MEGNHPSMSHHWPCHQCVVTVGLAGAVANALAFAAWSHPADARVSRTECTGFDGDVPHAGEALNDAASYAWVREWDEQWDRDSDSAAARISAGSLDARKFLYHEQIRLQAAPRGTALWIFLQREKRETAREYITSNELNLTLPGAAFAGSILTDSDSDKKWSDLGLALGRRKSLTDFAEGFIWSVDHYYNVKETSSARWSQKPYSWGFRFASPEQNATFAKAEIEIDEPATYEVDGTSCHFRRRGAHLQGNYRTGFSKNPFRWSVEHLKKKKSIESRYAERNVNSLDLTWGPSSNGQNTDTLGIKFNLDQLDRDGGAKSALRREIILYGGRTQIISGNLWLFLGGVGSLGTQRIGEDLDSIEQLKFQTGLEYRIAGDKGSFRTLANWDVDHLVWDFPYRKKGLRPWDGGLLQFSIYN